MNDHIRNLSSLGCNFAHQELNVVADPEQTIINALDMFWFDKKVFTLLIALLKFRISHLVNVKRLYNLSRELENDKKALLRVLALKVHRYTKDQRFSDLALKLNHRKNRLVDGPKKYSDLFYIQKKGVDKDFKKVGLEVADFFEEQPEKKLKTLKLIYKENLWLRLRALSGPDYRADTLYLVKSGLATTQKEVCQQLQCNKSSVSRIWSSIKGIEDLVEFV